MKPFWLTLGLLLLTILCCNAMPKAVESNTTPLVCCFEFSNFKLPLRRVADIQMTHSSCPNEGFIITSVMGRKICYKHDMEWASEVYKHHAHISRCQQH